MKPDPGNLLQTIEIETGQHPLSTVLWLHGLGADGSDFVPVVDQLPLSATLPVRFIFPHAPPRPVSINRGMVMRAWFDYDEVGHGGIVREDIASLRQSQLAVEALIAREKERGISAERIVLAGFSQGGALALQAGLRHPEKLAGIMALSCYLPAVHTFASEMHRSNLTVPIFMAHGRTDLVIPADLARLSRQTLIEAGYSVEWQEYEMAHSVCAQEIMDIGKWLKRVLA
ncbi:MAG TPA: alpha/beta fold hydrolase [Nitrosospira sp.]|nr:alpha/beta fold hydrolase [Nitrosospira sp.]